jgi:hypothetical protein
MEKSKFIDPKLTNYVNQYSLKLNEHQKKMIDRTMKLSSNNKRVNL